jgi:hypothetical protein
MVRHLARPKEELKARQMARHLACPMEAPMARPMVRHLACPTEGLKARPKEELMALYRVIFPFLDLDQTKTTQ